MTKQKFEIPLILSIVSLVAGNVLLGGSTDPWAIIVGIGLTILSWALALKAGMAIGEILAEKEKDKRRM